MQESEILLIIDDSRRRIPCWHFVECLWRLKQRKNSLVDEVKKQKNDWKLLHNVALTITGYPTDWKVIKMYLSSKAWKVRKVVLKWQKSWKSHGNLEQTAAFFVLKVVNVYHDLSAIINSSTPCRCISNVVKWSRNSHGKSWTLLSFRFRNPSYYIWWCLVFQQATKQLSWPSMI